jgi:hypothetical protein
VNYLVDEKETINFEMCVKQACFAIKTANKRIAQRAGGSIVRLAHFEGDDDGGYFMHLTVDTPGEAASIVPKVADDAEEIVISTFNPPNDGEFMDGDAFLYVNGNNVVMCMTAIRSAAIISFFQQFFISAKINKHAASFNFLDVADASKLAILHKRGVKEIQLRAALYSASFDYAQRKHQTVGVLGIVSKAIKALISKESDATNDALQIQLTIKVDGHVKSGAPIGKKRLEALAEDMLNNESGDDSYLIVTSDGQKITPEEITLKKMVDIDPVGKSLSRPEAYSALLSYYDELKRDGLLEI